MFDAAANDRAADSALTRVLPKKGIDLGSPFLSHRSWKKHPISNGLTVSKGFDRQLPPAEG